MGTTSFYTMSISSHTVDAIMELARKSIVRMVFNALEIIPASYNFTVL